MSSIQFDKGFIYSQRSNDLIKALMVKNINDEIYERQFGLNFRQSKIVFVKSKTMDCIESSLGLLRYLDTARPVIPSMIWRLFYRYPVTPLEEQSLQTTGVLVVLGVGFDQAEPIAYRVIRSRFENSKATVLVGNPKTENMISSMGEEFVKWINTQSCGVELI